MLAHEHIHLVQRRVWQHSTTLITTQTNTTTNLCYIFLMFIFKNNITKNQQQLVYLS